MFPEAGSVHQTLSKLVSKAGISVLAPVGTEQQHPANGDPAPQGCHQHSSGPGRAGGGFGPSLTGEVGYSGHAHHIHVHTFPTTYSK